MNRRYRQKEEQGFYARRRAGWGMNLFRNTRDGWIGGVAAGLAEHWELAPWMMRLGFVAAFLFTGTMALWAYLAAWIALSPRPRKGPAGPDGGNAQSDIEMEYDERRREYRPRKVFSYSESSAVRLQRARERLDAAVKRVEDMESYVTSRHYELNKEFSRL